MLRTVLGARGRRCSPAASSSLASGGIGTALTALAGGFSTAFDRLVATPVPTATDLPPTDSPRIASPEQPYTNAGSDRPRRLRSDGGRSATRTPRSGSTSRSRASRRRRSSTCPVGTTSRMVVPFDADRGPQRHLGDAVPRRRRSRSTRRSSPGSSTRPAEDHGHLAEGRRLDRYAATRRSRARPRPARRSSPATRRTAPRSRRWPPATARSSIELPLVPGDNEIEINGTDPGRQHRRRRR